MTTPVHVASVGTGVQDGGATTVTSPSITPSGSNRLALVHVTNSDGSPAAVSGVTLNGNACTQLGTTHNVATFWNQSLWYFKNPATSAMTATATFAAAQGERLIQVAVYSDVDQSSTFGTPKQTTAGNVSTITNSAINASVGDLVVHAVLSSRGSNPDTNTIDPNTGEVERIETATSPTAFDDAAIADKVATGTSESGSFETSASSSDPDGWGIISVALKGATGGGAAFGPAEDRPVRGQNRVGRGPYSRGRYAIRQSLDVFDSMPAAPVVAIQYVGDRAGTNQARPGRGPYSLGRYFVRTRLDAFLQQPTTYSDSISESGSAADSLTGILAAIAALSETGSGADAIAAALVAVGSLAESGSASDSDSSVHTAVGSIVEAGSAADVAAGSLIAVAALTEAASGTDSITSTTGNDSLLSESVSAADSFSSVVTAVGILSESGSVTDLLGSIASLIGELSESGSGSELLDGSIAGSTYNVSIAETAASGDALSSVLLAAAAIAETVSAIDAHGTLLEAAASLIETGAGGDSLVAQLSGVASLVEVATAIDAVTTNPRVPPRGNRIVLVSARSRRINVRLN